MANKVLVPIIFSHIMLDNRLILMEGRAWEGVGTSGRRKSTCSGRLEENVFWVTSVY